ncbi:MAG: penicillin-insensitive murein endopeptidase [Actinomycetota bacterium]
MSVHRTHPLWLSLAVAVACAAPAVCVPGPALAQFEPPPVVESPPTVTVTTSPILWRRSLALGFPWQGSLVDGVQLPAGGTDWFSWDFALRRIPNRGRRRWGTDYLLRKVLRVCHQYRDANLDSPRCAIGDLSRPFGGDFGPQFGGMGHRSHQNGLDADIYYPRLDRLERAPRRVEQIDVELAQDLVDRFVDAGAQFVFVGPHTGLTGPPQIVQPLIYHDEHLHVRFPNRRRF